VVVLERDFEFLRDLVMAGLGDGERFIVLESENRPAFVQDHLDLSGIQFLVPFQGLLAFQFID
jgi:hypothetical protein